MCFRQLESHQTFSKPQITTLGRTTSERFQHLTVKFDYLLIEYIHDTLISNDMLYDFIISFS